MSTAELKYSIIELVSSINDENRLKVIYQSLKAGSYDWWEDLSVEQKASIERGLVDLKKGRTISNKDAMTQLDNHIDNYE